MMDGERKLLTDNFNKDLNFNLMKIGKRDD